MLEKNTDFGGETRLSPNHPAESYWLRAHLLVPSYGWIPNQDVDTWPKLSIGRRGPDPVGILGLTVRRRDIMVA